MAEPGGETSVQAPFGGPRSQAGPPGVPLPGMPLHMSLPPGVPMPMPMPMPMALPPGVPMPMPMPMPMPVGAGGALVAPSAAVGASLALPFAAAAHPLAHAARSEGDVVEQRLYDARLRHFLQLAARRSGAQLALAYARDANAAVAAVLLALRDDTLLLLDTPTPEHDVGLHALLTLNLVPHTRVSVAALLDATTLLLPRQVIVVCGAFDAAPDLLARLHAHMASGGLVFTYNAAARLLAALFPGALAALSAGLSSSSKRVRVSLAVDAADRDAPLLAPLVALAATPESRLVRVAPTQRFTLAASQSALQPLLVESAPRAGQVLVLRARAGAGARGGLYHAVLCASDEGVAVRSAEQSRAYLRRVEAHAQLSAETKRMWRTAQQCALDDALYEAIALLPFIDLFFGILGRHLSDHGVL